MEALIYLVLLEHLAQLELYVLLVIIVLNLILLQLYVL